MAIKKKSLEIMTEIFNYFTTDKIWNKLVLQYLFINDSFV